MMNLYSPFPSSTYFCRHFLCLHKLFASFLTRACFTYPHRQFSSATQTVSLRILFLPRLAFPYLIRQHSSTWTSLCTDKRQLLTCFRSIYLFFYTKAGFLFPARFINLFALFLGLSLTYFKRAKKYQLFSNLSTIAVYLQKRNQF